MMLALDRVVFHPMEVNASKGRSKLPTRRMLYYKRKATLPKQTK